MDLKQHVIIEVFYDGNLTPVDWDHPDNVKRLSGKKGMASNVVWLDRGNSGYVKLQTPDGAEYKIELKKK